MEQPQFSASVQSVMQPLVVSERNQIAALSQGHGGRITIMSPLTTYEIKPPLDMDVNGLKAIVHEPSQGHDYSVM